MGRSPPGPIRAIFDPSSFLLISHCFLHTLGNAPTRCRSPPGSALDPPLILFLMISMWFYIVFQSRAPGPFWGPDVPTDTVIFDLGLFWESKRGPKTAPWRAQIRPAGLPEALRTCPGAPRGRLGGQGPFWGRFGAVWGSIVGVDLIDVAIDLGPFGNRFGDPLGSM